jgi:hypothetical protein
MMCTGIRSPQRKMDTLWFPPHCCDLHLAELMLAQVKHHVGMNNSGFKIYEMERLIKKGFASVTMDILNSLCHT